MEETDTYKEPPIDDYFVPVDKKARTWTKQQVLELVREVQKDESVTPDN